MIEIPRPFLKWAGGKSSSAEHILAHLPAKIGTYYEPLLGGGAVFFALARARRFERAVISDSNEELVATWIAIRDDVEAVIDAVRRLGPSRVTADKYYRYRQCRPRTPAGKAARMLFLNKTGFNGLYRVNQQGLFNVPFAKVSRWRPDYDNLRAVSRLLNEPGIEICCQDFASEERQLRLFDVATSGDAFYFDPPYLPESKTARFSEYTAGGFTLADHRRLGALFASLADHGVHVVASNAAVRGAERIYENTPGTEIYQLQARRAINSNGTRRGRVAELLIVNPGRGSGESRKDGKE